MTARHGILFFQTGRDNTLQHESICSSRFFSNFRRIIVEHVIVNQHYRTYFMHLFVTIFVIIVRVSDRFSRNTTRMFHMFIVSFRRKLEQSAGRVFYNNIYKSAIFKRFYDELNSCKKKHNFCCHVVYFSSSTKSVSDSYSSLLLFNTPRSQHDLL